MELLLLFIILQVVNVILSTIRSIVTIKCGKFTSALVSALYFGFYTVVLIYMNCELELWQKVVITAATNLVGVFVVKYGEELVRKDRLWRIEATIHKNLSDEFVEALTQARLSFSILPIENDAHTAYIIYSYSQDESTKAKQILSEYGAKYFVSETKIL